MEKVNSKYYCELCDKYYKSINSLCNHNKKFHPKDAPKDSELLLKSSKKLQIAPENIKNNEREYKCSFCEKVFSKNSNLQRHLKLNRCKMKDNIKNENEKLKKENAELKEMFTKQIDELKEQLTLLMNKTCKMHHKKFQKINNQLTNNTQYNNCTFNIVQLGQENLQEVLSKKEQLTILRKKHNSLNYLIDYIHCNQKFPEFSNVIVTNLQNNVAYKFDETKNNFVAINKDELIDDIIYYRINDLEEFYDINLNSLDEKTRNIITNIINKMEKDDKFISKKKDQIKLILYNNKAKPLDI